MKGESEGNPTRRYHAPKRLAAAADRREAIVMSAHRHFAERGWSGTTVRNVAADAGVSPKTIEALFRTKAELLRAAVDFAIRGDAGAEPVMQRESAHRVEAAPDAATMLDLHAAHLRLIVPRSAGIVSVVEHAASADAAVAELWRQIDGNRRIGVSWAALTLLGKPGRKRDLTTPHTEAIFWIAVNWDTYRTLTGQVGLDLDEYEQWLQRYYAATLLDRSAGGRVETS